MLLGLFDDALAGAKKVVFYPLLREMESSMTKTLFAAALMLAAGAVSAIPVSYTFRGSYDVTYYSPEGQPTWAGEWSGDHGPRYTTTMVFDNGGKDVRDVVWRPEDFLYLTYTSGDYYFRFDGSQLPNFNDFTHFRSDSLGRLYSGFLEVSNSMGHLWMALDFGDMNQWGPHGHGAFGGGYGRPYAITSLPGHIMGVPEPATLGLMSLGLAAITFTRRRRRDVLRNY